MYDIGISHKGATQYQYMLRSPPAHLTAPVNRFLLLRSLPREDNTASLDLSSNSSVVPSSQTDSPKPPSATKRRKAKAESDAKAKSQKLASKTTSKTMDRRTLSSSSVSAIERELVTRVPLVRLERLSESRVSRMLLGRTRSPTPEDLSSSSEEEEGSLLTVEQERDSPN
jgi:hypothetical protein